MKGFSKYILDNHPDPDSLLDTNNVHAQMTKLANRYAMKVILNVSEYIPEDVLSQLIISEGWKNDKLKI